MKRFTIFLAALLIASSAGDSLAAKKKKKPQTAPTTQESADQAAAYTRTLEKRADGIVATLSLPEADKAARVREDIIDQYRALSDWQAAPKTPDHEAARLKLHDEFLARLNADLTAGQVETVEDGMTANKVRVTYNAYCQIVPNLTDVEKAHMLELLKEARTQAIDGQSMDEKSLIFKKYKGKINIYLTAQGHDVGKAYKDWGAAQKAAHAGPATEPID